MAPGSSLPASTFRMHPFAPVSKAARTISASLYSVRKRIFVPGATWRICFAASIPFRLWKANVQQNQVRLQFFSLTNCSQSIRSFADDLQFRIALEQGEDGASARCEIVHYENAN